MEQPKAPGRPVLAVPTPGYQARPPPCAQGEKDQLKYSPPAFPQPCLLLPHEEPMLGPALVSESC